MKLLDDYLDLENQIHKYFGYIEDWHVYPISNGRDYYWKLVGSENDGEIHFAESLETLNSDGNYYSNEILTDRFLRKYVYRGKDYTMVIVDTRTDGNKFLQIFDNSKEIK